MNIITLFVIAVAMLLEGFGIWMLLGIDADEPSTRYKLLWLGALILTHWFGAIAYVIYRSWSPIERPPQFHQRNVALLKQGLNPQTGRS